MARGREGWQHVAVGNSSRAGRHRSQWLRFLKEVQCNQPSGCPSVIRKAVGGDVEKC